MELLECPMDLSIGAPAAAEVLSMYLRLLVVAEVLTLLLSLLQWHHCRASGCFLPNLVCCSLVVLVL
jgi:hypothetical protein